jgi:hypothetical protein
MLCVDEVDGVVEVHEKVVVVADEVPEVPERFLADLIR